MRGHQPHINHAQLLPRMAAYQALIRVEHSWNNYVIGSCRRGIPLLENYVCHFSHLVSSLWQRLVGFGYKRTFNNVKLE